MEKEAHSPSIPSESFHVAVEDDGAKDESQVKAKGSGSLGEIMQYATRWELLLNGVGLIAACAAGATQVGVCGSANELDPL